MSYARPIRRAEISASRLATPVVSFADPAREPRRGIIPAGLVAGLCTALGACSPTLAPVGDTSPVGVAPGSVGGGVVCAFDPVYGRDVCYRT